MYPQVTEAIDTLDIPLQRDAIAGAIALRDRLDGKIATAVGDYQAQGLHELDGSVTMASWLRHWAGLDGTGAVVAGSSAISWCTSSRVCDCHSSTLRDQ